MNRVPYRRTSLIGQPLYRTLRLSMIYGIIPRKSSRYGLPSSRQVVRQNEGACYPEGHSQSNGHPTGFLTPEVDINQAVRRIQALRSHKAIEPRKSHTRP